MNCKNITSIVIPDGVTNIDYGVFYNCRSLSSVTIPDTVEIADVFSFYGCDSLITVKLPESVMMIDYRSFDGCENLMSIVIENPECYINDESETIFSNTIIYGYKGSTAEAYAEKYNREFMPLDKNPNGYIIDKGV